MVGGKKFVTIKVNELQSISHLQFQGTDVPAVSCRSLLMRTQAEPTGILFRAGEHVLLESDLGEQVVQLINFFSICNSGQYYTIIQGTSFNFYEENPTQALADHDNPTVVASSTVLVTNATNILCKIMLYPYNDGTSTRYAVIDYHRPTLPTSVKDVVVPIHPTVGDMVQVCGSDNETWYALVRSVNTASKTCQVNFYIEDDSHPGRYRRETFLRCQAETLHWDSVLDLANGTWSGNFWYFSTSATHMHA